MNELLLNEFLSLMVVLALFAGLFLFSLYFKNKKKKSKHSQPDDSILRVFYSSEALWENDKVLYQFKGLISDIAEYQAKKAGKLVTMAEARRGSPKEKQISPKDMEVAFLEAIKELQAKISKVSSSCTNVCDRKSLLEKIQKLRKKYEK